MPKQKQHRRTVLTIFVCVLALLLNLVLSWQIFRTQLSLHQQLQSDMIQKDIIPVSMQIPDNMTVQEAKNTFERLTDGFETQYPGFGVDLKLYADAESYPGAENAVVFNAAQGGADLSPVIRELQNLYLTDLSAFPNAVPLSFTVPVVYQYADGRQADFDAFLTSSDMAVLEQNPELSGMVEMTPVAENGMIQKIYTNFCCVNPDSDVNSQKIGMLWIEYLLSEEAQSILFAEHYGDLPLHKRAFDMAVTHHQNYAVLNEIKSARKGERSADE